MDHSLEIIINERMSWSLKIMSEVSSRVSPDHPLLVAMVSVLDVLREPVLNPVDHFAVNWRFSDLHDNPELVVLPECDVPVQDVSVGLLWVAASLFLIGQSCSGVFHFRS